MRANMAAAASSRVLCVNISSTSGNVIIERFYEPALSEHDQMEWRTRLWEASQCAGGPSCGGVGEVDAERVAEVCGVARGGERGEENMVWCRVGDLRFFAVGSGEYDELALAAVLQALVTSVKAMVKKTFSEAQAFEHYGGAGGSIFFLQQHFYRGSNFFITSPIIPMLVNGMSKLCFQCTPQTRPLSSGMICLALDEIVSDGVVEATDWDNIRRGIKLKMSET